MSMTTTSIQKRLTILFLLAVAASAVTRADAAPPVRVRVVAARPPMVAPVPPAGTHATAVVRPSRSTSSDTRPLAPALPGSPTLGHERAAAASAVARAGKDRQHADALAPAGMVGTNGRDPRSFALHHAAPAAISRETREALPDVHAPPETA